MSPEFAFLPVRELARRIRSGQTRPLELAEYFLDRLARLGPAYNALVTLTRERALREAAEAEGELRAGRDRGLLHGIPYGAKDLLAAAGYPTTWGAPPFREQEFDYDATVISRLRDAGAVLVGKLATVELAGGMGYTQPNAALTGPGKNPWNPEFWSGGSSNGPGSAVAAGLVPFALGTETWGSIITPSAFCGVCGLRPTYGRVSRFGLIAYASSLDQIGPMARSVRDLALLMDAISGLDPLDATSLDLPQGFQKALEEPLPPLRLGVVREGLSGNSPGVEKALEEALEVFQGLGFGVKEVSWPSLPLALAAYYILAPAEASSNLARYDGSLFGVRGEGEEIFAVVEATRARFGLEVKRRVLVGTFVLSSGYYEAYYGRAQAFRKRLRAEARALFQEVDLLLLPTTPHPAFPLGSRPDPLAMYREDLYTVGANLTGLPALSFPAGFEGHLPVGLQLLAPWGKDELLLKAALAHEEATGRAFLKTPLGEAL